MNDVEQIEFLLLQLNKANLKGVYTLQESTTLGMICNELMNQAKQKKEK